MGADDFFGQIDNPLADSYGDVAAGSGGGGIIGFISNLIRLVTIAAGIWTFINTVIAGLTYITSAGDPEKTASAWRKINMSLIGLAIIVSSFALAAIIGLVLFGDSTAILQPKITGPGL